MTALASGLAGPIGSLIEFKRAIGLPYKASGNSSSVISSGRDAAVAACLGALLDPASAGGPARVTPERAFGSGTCLRDRLTKAAAIT